MDGLKKPGWVVISPAVRPTTDEKAPFNERLRPDEQTGMMEMNGSRILLEQALPKLERRFKKLGMWWMVKGALGLLTKAGMMAELSGDPAQIKTLTARAEHMIAHVGYKKASTDPEMTVVPVEALNIISEALMDGTCSFCTKKGEEARKCKLQWAMRACTIIGDSKAIDDCIIRPYSDAAYYGLLEEDEAL